MKSVLTISRSLPVVIGALSAALMLSCGQQRRATSSGRVMTKAPSADAKPEDGTDKGRTASGKREVSWDLACEAPTQSDEQIVDQSIVGGGMFRAQGAEAYGITFRGSHCDGTDPRKDFLFLFDSSSAMAARDPLVDGSCARLDMVNALMTSFAGDSGSRFALIAFSGASQNAVLSSGRFYDSEQGLLGGLDFALNGQTLGEAVCDSTQVGTNYEAGLTAAESLIKVSGAVDAGTIIIFVSADRPLFGQTGEATAARLRAGGALITTLMVGGPDEVLRDRIASIDRDGNPLHAKVDGADGLLAAVTDLASNIVIPDVLRYRAVGTSTWTAVNLYPLPQTLSWSLPRMEFPVSAWPNGVEVEHLHFLSDGTGKHVTKGTLTFQP